MRIKSRLAKLESSAPIRSALSPAAVEERRRRALMEADPRHVDVMGRLAELVRLYPGFLQRQGPLFENIARGSTGDRKAERDEFGRVFDLHIDLARKLAALLVEFKLPDTAI